MEGPALPQSDYDSAIEVTDILDAPAAETRRERKALAAKSARKRSRERLASLEMEAIACRQWVGSLQSKVDHRRPVTTDTAIIADSGLSGKDEAAREAMPPKKRQRAEHGLPVLMVACQLTSDRRAGLATEAMGAL